MWLAVLGLASAPYLWPVTGIAQPLEATLEFPSLTPDPTFPVGTAIPLTLKVRVTSAGPVVTGEGFAGQEFWRRLYFTDPLGRTVINAAEATIHRTERVYQCLSRGQALLDVAIPVVPIDVLAGTSSPPEFYREYPIADLRPYFDLTQPGRYSVTARIPLQAFTSADDVITDCDQFPGLTVLNVGAGTGAQGLLVESNSLTFNVVNTLPGSSVTVHPVDSTTGATPVDVSFAGVSQQGATGLTTSASGPAAPSGFSLGSPPVFYDITTTAVFTPPVGVCIRYSEPSFGNEAALRLLHFEGGAWQDVTSSLDTVLNVICGSVTSLSPFAAFQGLNQPPVAKPGANKTVIVGSFVTLDGSQSFDPDHQPGPLTYQWTQVGGPAVSLAGATTVHPTFTAAAVGTDTFQLVVVDGAAASTPATVSVAVQYKFSGFAPPVGNGGTFKLGRNIPLKFKLTDAKGRAIVTARAQLAVVKPPATTPAVTGQFTVDKEEGKKEGEKERQYQFDLKTTALSKGTWRIDAILDDGTTHSITIQLQ